MRLRPYKVKKKVKLFNALKEKRKTWELIEQLIEKQIQIEDTAPPKDLWRNTYKTN